MPGERRDQRNLALHPLEDHRVDAIHAMRGQREHRRKRLQQEHDARMAALDDMEASVPDLNAVMMVRVSGDVMPGGQVG